jgi:hypothetical protein
MKRLASRVVISTVAIVSLTALSGCFLFSNSFPDGECVSDDQCFVSQGEFCNTQTRKCEVGTGIDAGLDVDAN